MDSVAVYRARIQRSKEAGSNKVSSFWAPSGVHLTQS